MPSSAYIPRPARLELRISGVPVFTLRLENTQARQLMRLFRSVRDRVVPALTEGEARDEDVADALAAALLQTYVTEITQED